MLHTEKYKVQAIKIQMQFFRELDIHGVYGLNVHTNWLHVCTTGRTQWTQMEEPSLPEVSGPQSSRLHNDQVRSRDTARSKRESGEKAIWVTVRLWHGRACSCFQVEVLHNRIAACSALDACTQKNRHVSVFFHVYKTSYWRSHKSQRGVGVKVIKWSSIPLKQERTRLVQTWP